MDTQQIIAELKEFLNGELHASTRLETLTDNYDLITSGIITSMGLFRLLSFINQRFEVSFNASNLEVKHFRTLQTIAQQIQEQRSASS